MKKEKIEVKRLSDEEQIQIISDACQVSIKEAKKIADKMYEKGCEIFSTATGKVASSLDIKEGSMYELTKKFLSGETTILAISKEKEIPYTRAYKEIRELIQKASGGKSIWINNRVSREKYLEFFE